MKTQKQNFRFITLILLAITAITGISTGRARADDGPFAGVWNTVVLGENVLTLALKQDGKKVKGTLTPGEGTVEGKVEKKVLTLRWTQEPNMRGSARLALTDDGQGFIGVMSNGDDPDKNGRPWNGVRRQRKTYSGKWNLMSGGAFKPTLSLKQKGDEVNGTFTPGNGKIDGEKNGDILTFKWRQDDGTKGKGRMELNADGQSLTGRFIPTEGPSKDEIPVIGSRRPVSFQGEWSWKNNDGENLLGESIFFEQKGNRANPGEDVMGTVIGDTLFINWGATGNNHNGYLVLDDDGKSFEGFFKFHGSEVFPCTGTFLRSTAINKGK